MKQIDCLVVFVAEKDTADNHFRSFLKVSRNLMHLQDVEFAFLYPADLGGNQGNIAGVTSSDFYEQFGFGVRVYRRNNIGDYKDYNGEPESDALQ